MYWVTCLNEKGEKFTKKFPSEFLYKGYLNKVKRSKKLILISHGREY